MRPYASKFPLAVQTQEDLQAIQDDVLHGYSLSRYDAVHDSYTFRGLVEFDGRRMIVDLPIDGYGTPKTIYPVNGDFVRRNDARGEDAGGVPLDRRYLRDWEPDE